MRMRHVLLATAAMAAMASAGFAGQIKIYTDPPAPYNGFDGSGGAFTVQSTAGYNGTLGGLGAAADSFYSFCIERDEFISNGGSYYTAITNTAINGGNGGPDPDPISEGTALLYSMFRAGADFGGVVGTVDSDKETTGLQYAIWQLEQETGSESGDATVQAAKTRFLAVAAGAQAGNYYGVAVLNLYANANLTGNSQDQLTLVPTPQASLAGMSLLGVMGVMGFMKKRRKLQESELD